MARQRKTGAGRYAAAAQKAAAAAGQEKHDKNAHLLDHAGSPLKVAAGKCVKYGQKRWVEGDVIKPGELDPILVPGGILEGGLVPVGSEDKE